MTDDRRIVAFVGTSLTAGYGLATPDSGYVARLQGHIDAAGLAFSVLNAGVSGDTSRGGLERIDWVLNADPVVLVVELGANDGLRGIAPASMRENLVEIVRRARARDPDMSIVLVGMQAPPNMGEAFAREFGAVFPALAEELDTALVPFLLDGVGGVPELNQADGIHPTAEGHRVLADNVWPVLRPLLDSLSSGR